MKIAVAILNWNGQTLLKRFLPSVVLYSKEARIYVIDNASTDASITFLQEHFPEVKIIQNNSNGGFAKGYNDGLEKIPEEIVVLLNSDVEVSLNWLKPIISEFESHPETAAIQPKILDYKKRDTFEYAGAAGGFIDNLGYPYCRGRIFDYLEKDVGQYNETTPIFWASGACLALRKNVFYAAGKFDEDFFAHQEEIDLCWRFYNLGYKVKAVGNSRVYHLGGGTLNSQAPQKTYLNFRNSLFTLVKNLPGKRFFPILFVRLFLDGLAGIKFLIEGKIAHCFAIVKAHFSFYTHFIRIRKKRGARKKRGQYFGRIFVLVSYFLLGKKKYTDL